MFFNILSKTICVESFRVTSSIPLTTSAKSSINHGKQVLNCSSKKWHRDWWRSRPFRLRPNVRNASVAPRIPIETEVCDGNFVMSLHQGTLSVEPRLWQEAKTKLAAQEFVPINITSIPTDLKIFLASRNLLISRELGSNFPPILFDRTSSNTNTGIFPSFVLLMHFLRERTVLPVPILRPNTSAINFTTRSLWEHETKFCTSIASVSVPNVSMSLSRENIKSSENSINARYTGCRELRSSSESRRCITLNSSFANANANWVFPDPDDASIK
mmetsp:Transcript_8427/g.12557  ORF Transcript_8427/g.12557 Transcript_8427/m.12557 type:complete len:272 (-) Transcript_8427:379-1194(-)